MVRNVVVPARSSVVKVVFRSASLKCLPSRVVDMYVFRRLGSECFCGCGGGGGVSVSVSIWDKRFFLVREKREMVRGIFYVCVAVRVLS